MFPQYCIRRTHDGARVAYFIGERDTATYDGQLYNGQLVVITDAAICPPPDLSAPQPVGLTSFAYAKESEQELYNVSFAIGSAVPITAQEYKDVMQHLTPRGQLDTALDLLHELYNKY